MRKTYTLMLLLSFSASLVLFSCTSFNSNRLMSWEDYVLHPRKEPYVLELDKQSGSLVYYGAFHNVDPAHPQFQEIEEKWEEFQPTLAYCEGIIWPLEESRTKAIENYGEQGLVTYLAARDGIQIECIDPSLKEQATYLKKYFPPHLIKVYYVLRQAAVNRMLKKDLHDLYYVDQLFRCFRRIKDFSISPTNLNEYERMVSDLFPSLDDWKKIPYFYFRSPDSGGFLAAIHQKLNEYRDYVMIRKVSKALKKGKRIFAVVGRSHVVIQEAVLKSLI